MNTRVSFRIPSAHLALPGHADQYGLPAAAAAARQAERAARMLPLARAWSEGGRCIGSDRPVRNRGTVN